MSGVVLVAALAAVSVASLGARAEMGHRAALRARIGSGDRRRPSPEARRSRSSRRREPSRDELGSAVAAVAAALRAGLSVPQALGYAAEEADEPLRSELGELVERVRFGTPLDAAVTRWADRGGEDARLVAGALLLHRRMGGDLPAVLDRVVATLRERSASRRELRSLTAQARLSGLILGLLPVGFLLFLAVTSPRDVAVVMTVPEGRAALGTGAILEVLAFAWIRRILRGA